MHNTVSGCLARCVCGHHAQDLDVAMLSHTRVGTCWPTEVILGLAMAWLWPSAVGHRVAAPSHHRATATATTALPSCWDTATAAFGRCRVVLPPLWHCTMLLLVTSPPRACGLPLLPCVIASP